VHIGAAAVGLSALLAASASAFTLVKLAGAAYLVYIGISLLRSPIAPEAMSKNLAPMSPGTVFVQGFFTNVLNPKVALFFIAFLPQFVEPDAPGKAAALLFLGAVFNLNGTLWNLMVAWFSARLAATPAFGGARAWVQRAIGGALIGLGARLAWTERP